MKICLYFVLFGYLANFTYTIQQREAIIITPVADCLGESCVNIRKKEKGIKYETIPLCARGSSYTCPRMHQLLFHQRILVLEECGYEAKIQMPHLFFQINDSAQRFNTCWIKKKYLIYLDQLKRQGINLENIPPSGNIDMLTLPNRNIVSLSMPHYDKHLNINFSAGTRFISATPIKNNVLTHHPVYALNPKTLSIDTIFLPKEKLIYSHNQSPEQKTMCFISLLKRWAHHPTGYVPYVWGGASVKTFCTQKPFSQTTNNGSTIYTHADSSYPHTGLDCAGMIVLAAQTCGIPFFFKNTTTIQKNLRPINPHESVEPGDILWFPSHVMVVVNIQQQTLIEARHYNSGYGKIHEIAVDKVFKDIYTFKDLKQACLNNKPLCLLDSNEQVAQTIKNCRILKLRSVWESKKI